MNGEVQERAAPVGGKGSRFRISENVAVNCYNCIHIGQDDVCDLHKCSVTMGTVCDLWVNETTLKDRAYAERAGYKTPEELPTEPRYESRALPQSEIDCSMCSYYGIEKDEARRPWCRRHMAVLGVNRHARFHVCRFFEEAPKAKATQRQNAEPRAPAATVEGEEALEDEADNDIKKHHQFIKSKAVRILKEGKPIEYIMDVWHRDYIGGDHYGRSLIFSGFCGTCNNTFGLHPTADGDSGSGKSWAQKAMINLLSQRYIVAGSVTPRALYYNDIKDGTTVYLDDIGKMPPELADLIKITCGGYQQHNELLTVVKNEGGRKTSPKCVNWWLNGVDANSFNIQLLNRAVNISLDEVNKTTKTDHLKAVMRHQFKDAMTGRPAFEMTEEVEICREIHRHLLAQRQANVVIPWLEDEQGEILEWLDEKNPRNILVFLDMVKVSASIHRYQREKVNGSIVATMDDYDSAILCWKMVSKEQVSKLNRKDQEIITALRDLNADKEPVDLYAVESKTGIQYQTLYYRLFGRPKDGIDGLIDRYDNIRVHEETHTEYEKEIVNDDHFGDKEKKIGSKSRKRTLISLVTSGNQDAWASSVVDIDRPRAEAALKNYLLNK